MRLYYTNKNACSVITNVLPANGGGHSISGSCISLRSLAIVRRVSYFTLPRPSGGVRLLALLALLCVSCLLRVRLLLPCYDMGERDS